MNFKSEGTVEGKDYNNRKFMLSSAVCELFSRRMGVCDKKTGVSNTKFSAGL